MNRITRKKLKKDEFVEEVGTIWDFFIEHTEETIKYGAIAAAVLIVAGGIWFYIRHQADAREKALAQAMLIDNAVIGPNPQPPNLNFATQEEKDKARTKAYADIVAKYHGSAEAAMAGIYLASAQADKGNLPEAEKIYKDIVDSAPEAYASLARVSLAQIYAAEGKSEQAKSLLQYAIDHPTSLISKDEATLEMGKALAAVDPAQARKLLQPLSTSPRSAVSRAAIDELGKIPQAN